MSSSKKVRLAVGVCSSLMGLRAQGSAVSSVVQDGLEANRKSSQSVGRAAVIFSTSRESNCKVIFKPSSPLHLPSQPHASFLLLTEIESTDILFLCIWILPLC